jgi:hypothetical protein
MHQKIISQAYQTFEKLWQRALSAPSDIALFISNLDVVEQKVLYPRYQRFIREYQPLLNHPTSEEQKIVQELEKYGVAVTTLADLEIPHSDRFFLAAENISKELKSDAQNPLYVGRHTLNINAEQIMRYPELFLWGADAKLLRIIENYLKLPVAYDGLSYYYSLPDGRETGPRKWHQDKEDWQMIKVGVYINDVNEDGGPFECVTPEANEFLCKTLKTQSVRRYKTAFHQEIQEIVYSH